MFLMKAGRQRVPHAYALPALACEALTGHFVCTPTNVEE